MDMDIWGGENLGQLKFFLFITVKPGEAFPSLTN